MTEQVTQDDFEKGLIYPQVKDILKVSFNLAVRVAEQIFDSGLTSVERPGDIRVFIKEKMFVPEYK